MLAFVINSCINNPVYCTQSNDKYLIVELSLDNFQKLLFFLPFYKCTQTPYCYWIDELVNMTILQFVQRSLNLRLTFWVDHTPPISIIIQHTTLQDWPVPLPYNSVLPLVDVLSAFRRLSDSFYEICLYRMSFHEK